MKLSGHLSTGTNKLKIKQKLSADGKKFNRTAAILARNNEN